MSRTRHLVVPLVALAIALTSATARAHNVGLAFLDLKVDGSTVTGALDIPASELQQGLQLDHDHDGRLERADIDADAKSLGEWLAQSVRLVANGKVCEGSGEGASLRDGGLVTLRATWRCTGDVESMNLASRIAQTLGGGQSTFARATRGKREAEALLSVDSSTATFDLATDDALKVAGEFVLLGMEHIYTGIDHVLFLITLLMLGGSLRRILAIATAFTIAHSITLSLAALGIVQHVPPRMVESAIALSIAYVAVENYLVAPKVGPKEPWVLRWRWLVTFAFGLVHGFGFASALKSTGLPTEHLPVALATFNVGVELGQATIIVVAWPLLSRIATTDWYRPRGVRFASLGVFGVAAFWFVQRAFG